MNQPATLVTGASGFVGRAVVRCLLEAGSPVHATVRQAAVPTMASPGLRVFGGLELAEVTDWSPALAGVGAIVHCAARVHMLRDDAADPLAAFRAVNVTGTLHLANQAVAMGVKRFVFVSSIGVNGGQTSVCSFRADDNPAPHSPYAHSKLEAETALFDLSRRSGLEVTVVRPPLVYGPNAPGNFRSLLSAVRRGVPLPLGAVQNRRSLVALDNLTDLLVCCTRHPAAAGEVFLVSDGEDLSTTELLRGMAAALGRPARLLPVPSSLFRWAAEALGKPSVAQSLLGSLQVDIDKTRRLLGWSPIVSVHEALTRTVQPDCAHWPPGPRTPTAST